MIDFKEEAFEVKKIDAFNYDMLYEKSPYYRPLIAQNNLVSAPQVLILNKVADIPILVKVEKNNELLDKYNLVADKIDVSITLSIGYLDEIGLCPLQGDVFDYQGLRYEILKLVEFDFFKNTRIPIHYLGICVRYKETVFQRDINSEVKYILPAKTANQYDKDMRDVDLVKDPDNPNYTVRN